MARPGFSLDRKFKRLARSLDDVQPGFGEILARGSLELLWDSAYEACDDYLGDSDDVEALAHWGGKAGTLTTAMLAAGGEGRSGFIDEIEGHPGTYRVHDLYDHAPDYVQKRLAREAQREAKGKSITDLRREAGKKGAASTHGKRPASVGQADGKRLANGGRLPTEIGQASTDEAASGEQCPASGWQIARTPSPAPAPAPAHEEDPPHARVRDAAGNESPAPVIPAKEDPAKANAGSGEGATPQRQDGGDAGAGGISATLGAAGPAAPVARPRARLVSGLGASDPHPLTTSVLAALYDRGLDVAPPGPKSEDRVEAAIRDAGSVPAAVERLAAIYADPAAKKPITYHVDAIRGVRSPRQTRGDLGADLEPWPTRLTPEERAQARAELVAIAGPDFEAAPLQASGDPSIHPVEAIRAFQERWRAIAEART